MPRTKSDNSKDAEIRARVEAELKEFLRDLAASRRESESLLIREALREYRDRHTGELEERK